MVAVELNDKARDLKNFCHPERAVYMVGSETHGIPDPILNKCNHVLRLHGERSMNVAVAASIVMYHRVAL